MWINKKKIEAMGRDIKSILDTIFGIDDTGLTGLYARVNKLQEDEKILMRKQTTLEDAHNFMVKNIDDMFNRCYVCNKTDFVANMASLDKQQLITLGLVREADIGVVSLLGHYNKFNVCVHPECAHIKRSDDGNGWCKCDTHKKESK